MLYPDLIKAGPGSRLAFLEQADPQLIAETLVSFANTEGGTLVIGLKEDGKPSKLTIDSEKLEKALREAEEHCNPTVVVGNWEEMDTGPGPKDPDESGNGAANGSKIYALRVPRSIELHALADGRVLRAAPRG